MALIVTSLTFAIMFGFPLLANGNPKNNFVPVIKIILGIIVVISFFLPWLNADTLLEDYTLGGYEIPSKFQVLFNPKDGTLRTDYYTQIRLLLSSIYIIPISALAIIIFGIYRRNKEIQYVAGILGTIVMLLILGTIFIKKDSNDELISHLDIGFYLTIIAGFLLWTSSLMTQASNDLQEEEISIIAETEVTKENGNEIYSELLKLQTLREKNVINEDVFERERKKLLEKLENI